MPSGVQWYVTQAGAVALQAAGIPGWTLPQLDVATALPAPPGRAALNTAFAVPTYAGYAASVLTWTQGHVLGPNGLVYSSASLAHFSGPSSGPGATGLGFFLSDGTTHTVWAWGQAVSAFNLLVPTDFVEIALLLNEVEQLTGTLYP